ISAQKRFVSKFSQQIKKSDPHLRNVGYKEKELSFRDNRNMFVGFKKRVEIEEGIVTFGLVCMALIG
ncbi:hypothetical protein, partial [Microcoleus sp. C2D2]|uniref:hypothetical protein n=1 Tax=Microcoleus sp. C2D2 TaxID=3055326 RepID=UPI002FD6C33A